MEQGWRESGKKDGAGMRERVKRRDKAGMEEESGKEGWSRDGGRECKEGMEQGWGESGKEGWSRDGGRE
jgi:hypothetical protein